ncbi:hypothetical protein, partial [Bacillus suaedae]
SIILHVGSSFMCVCFDDIRIISEDPFLFKRGKTNTTGMLLRDVKAKGETPQAKTRRLTGFPRKAKYISGAVYTSYLVRIFF